VSRLEAASLISFKKNSEKKSGNFFLKNFQTIAIYFFNWIVNKKKTNAINFFKNFQKISGWKISGKTHHPPPLRRS
jgi:hypothetical protein